MEITELNKLYELLEKLKKERLAEYVLDEHKDIIAQAEKTGDWEEVYEIDDYDKLIEGIDIVEAVIKEM